MPRNFLSHTHYPRNPLLFKQLEVGHTVLLLREVVKFSPGAGANAFQAYNPLRTRVNKCRGMTHLHVLQAQAYNRLQETMRVLLTLNHLRMLPLCVIVGPYQASRVADKPIEI